jgi:hypothetical protein
MTHPACHSAGRPLPASWSWAQISEDLGSMMAPDIWLNFSGPSKILRLVCHFFSWVKSPIYIIFNDFLPCIAAFRAYSAGTTNSPVDKLNKLKPIILWSIDYWFVIFGKLEWTAKQGDRWYRDGIHGLISDKIGAGDKETVRKPIENFLDDLSRPNLELRKDRNVSESQPSINRVDILRT